MSSSEVRSERPAASVSTRARRFRAAALLLAGAAALLSGCTAGPLYGSGGAGAALTVGAPDTSIRGLVSIPEPNDRTTQLVRNALLTRLNGGDAPARAPYELVLAVSGSQGGVVVEPASGLPTAAVYRIAAAYRLVRQSDNKLVGTGTYRADSPYDQSSQLFAADRAASNARQEAAESVALKVELAVATLLRQDAQRR